MDFRKRFSVGLPVIDTAEVFDQFLDEYADYIDNIYFSLPLGDQFHSRVVTQRILHDEKKQPYFLELLRSVKKHGVRLELLFNTEGLSEADLVQGKAFMDGHGLEPDEIGIRKEYYSAVRKLFPGKELVYSFNNFPASSQAYFNEGMIFDRYVVGRQFIRDRELLQQIRAHNAKTVLLLNNGCSFTCGGCGSGNHCHDAYFGERSVRSSEFLYALQSIFPFEIHEGYLDIGLVDFFKIASRNAGTAYIRSCMDSYIHNDASGTEANPNKYLLWSRLTWHADHFREFDYEKLREIKERIYQEPGFGERCRKSGEKTAFELDLTDAFALGHPPLSELQAQMKSYAANALRLPKMRLNLRRVYLGVSYCEELLPLADTDTLCRDIRYLRSEGIKAVLVVPPIATRGAELVTMLDALKREDCLPDEFVANDEAVFVRLCRDYGLPTALGRHFDLKAFTSQTERLNCYSDDAERKALFSDSVRAFIERNCVPYVLCDMDAGGLWISERESFGVSAYLQHRLTKKNLFCLGAVEGGCGGRCLGHREGKESGYGRLLCSPIPFTRDVQSTLLEKRCAFILKPFPLCGDGEEKISHEEKLE